MPNNPLFDLMYKGESGAAGYNAYNRGTRNGRIVPADDDIEFSQLTLGTVMDLQRLPRTDPDRLFAVGKYQITPDTLGDAVRALRLDRDQPFTPELQDRIFGNYLITSRRSDVQGYITGKEGVTLEEAQVALAKEWASFPDPNKNGASYYSDGINKAHISLQESASALNEMRRDYAHHVAQGMSAEQAWQATVQGDAIQREQPGPVQSAPGQGATPGGFEAAIGVMLPARGALDPHVTGEYGEHRSKGPHGGVDFNYEGGQSGVNLRHPVVNSPVSGRVTFSGGSYGTVKIVDADGNSHELLHLQSRSVQQGDLVEAGQPIGTMGGRGPGGPNQYAQHVHYQLRDPNGRIIDPQGFWDSRGVEQEQGAPATDRPSDRAMRDGLLLQGEKGESVRAVQAQLAALGYTGSDGKPLGADADFGAHTRHAVEAFQRAHGLDADGKVGSHTFAALADARTRPLVSEATHPSHALYTAIGAQLPAGTRADTTANITLQAMENGITKPAELQAVLVRDSDVFVRGVTPGFNARVDLNAPTANLQAMSDHMARQNQQQASQQRSPDPVLQ